MGVIAGAWALEPEPEPPLFSGTMSCELRRELFSLAYPLGGFTYIKGSDLGFKISK